MSGLSFDELRTHLFQQDLELWHFGKEENTPMTVVIRGEHQDYGIAAVHLEHGTLVIDLGCSIEEAQR